MPYFLLGLSILVGGYLIFRGLRLRGPINLSRLVGFVVAIGVFAMIAVTAASGRLGAFGWLLLLLPLILQWKNLRQGLGSMRRPSPGRTSDIETAWLRMTLEHDSGVLKGTVLRGPHRGRTLDELSFDELLDLLHECRVDDPQSAEVLESYLDRVHGAGWRENGDTGSGSGSAGATRSSGGAMTAAEAYEILGLQPGATDRDIREAHRRLLKLNHPDRGGSTWLAAQINLAKDVLLPGG
jgi:hypothetical protein